MTTITAFDYEPTAHESRADDRNVHDALRIVETHLAPPVAGRERGWLTLLAVAVGDLADAMAAKATSDDEYTSLLAEIELREPRFTSQIATLREYFDEIATRVERLQARLDASRFGPIDVEGLRDDVASIARELRFHRSTEADLVYEAVNVDLGAGG